MTHRQMLFAGLLVAFTSSSIHAQVRIERVPTKEVDLTILTSAEKAEMEKASADTNYVAKRKKETEDLGALIKSYSSGDKKDKSAEEMLTEIEAMAKEGNLAAVRHIATHFQLWPESQNRLKSKSFWTQARTLASTQIERYLVASGYAEHCLIFHDFENVFFARQIAFRYAKGTAAEKTAKSRMEVSQLIALTGMLRDIQHHGNQAARMKIDDETRAKRREVFREKIEAARKAAAEEKGKTEKK